MIIQKDHVLCRVHVPVIHTPTFRTDKLSVMQSDRLMYKKKFNSLGKFVSNGILPSTSKAYSLLNKVYKNACSRYGKVLMTLIDEMNEDKLDENHLNLNYDWFYILNRNNTYIDYELY